MATNLTFNKFSFLFSLLLFLSLSACESEQETLAFTSISTTSSLPIDDLIIVDNQLLGVGGDTWQKGTCINYHLDDGVLEIKEVSNKRIFTFFENEEKWLAAGVDARIYEDIYSNTDWPIKKLPAWGLIKDVVKTPTGYLAVGGKSFKNGYVYVLNEEFEWIKSIEVDQELTAIAEGNNNEYIISAFGGLFKINKDLEVNFLPYEGDFYTDISIIGNKGICIGSNGTILKTIDGGNTWQFVTEGNQLLSQNTVWNRILPHDLGWVIGGRDSQLALLSQDQEIESTYAFEEDIDILSMAITGQKVFLGGRSGKLGYIILP